MLMLLRHTTDEVMERTALTVNPAKTCQPIGAMYAALGMHNCLPHSHGSQGCCSYHRSTLTRHYKEPVMAATSSFTEGSSVFGGQANLLQAIQTIFGVYNPDVIAVHTTCLSETIGDDMVQIIAKAVAEGKVPAGKHVIHCNTPSYLGSHVTGFSSMVKRWSLTSPIRTAEKKQPGQHDSGLGRTDRHARAEVPGARAWASKSSCFRTPPTCWMRRRPASTSSIPRAARRSSRFAARAAALARWGWDLGLLGSGWMHWKRSAACRAKCWNCRSACRPPTASSTRCAPWPE